MAVDRAHTAIDWYCCRLSRWTGTFVRMITDCLGPWHRYGHLVLPSWSVSSHGYYVIDNIYKMVLSLLNNILNSKRSAKNSFLLNWIKIKCVEFKKCMLHVKQTVYYTVSFTCNIQFLNSTYFIFNQFKSNNFLHFFCC